MPNRIETAIVQWVIAGLPMERPTVELFSSVRLIETIQDVLDLTERINLSKS